jgi:hypothetical protein
MPGFTAPAQPKRKMKKQKVEISELETLMYNFRQREFRLSEREMRSMAELLAAEGFSREQVASIMFELIFQDQLPN